MTYLKPLTLALVVTCVCMPATRAEDINSLARTIEQVRITVESYVAAQDEAHARDLAYIKHQLDSLKVVVLRLSQRQIAQSTTDSLLACLAEDIQSLKAENQLLRTMLTTDGQEYASIDDIPSVGEGFQTPVAAVPTVAGVSYTGWIDVSNYTDYNSNQSDFNLDQLEVDLETDVTQRGSLRADVEYLPDGEGGFDLGLEQAYFSYGFGADQHWALTFGKFNAPIGYEVPDPDGLYLYTYSLVYSYGLPTNLTGVLSTWKPNSVVDWKLYLANGWDLNADNNREKTLGTRFGLTPAENLTLGLSALYGPEQDGVVGSKRTVFDADLTWSPIATVSLGADVSFGRETRLLEDGSDAEWSGALLLAQVSLTEKFVLFNRIDYFNDRDGVRTGVPQEAKAVAISPNYQISEVFGAGIELRYDWSNRDAFSGSDGSPKNNQFSSAVQFSFGF